ncbi:MAG TPA: flagellar protein FlgN [Lachnospiraceae bacterium]|nr:flagellar protein FlgN [Lachnospiraceae bacterium]
MVASLIEELVDVLDNELEIYQQLIPISNEKTQIIVKNDLAALQEVTEKEQCMADQITSLENKRNQVMTNVKIVLNRKSDTLDLKTLIQLLENQPKEQKTLSILHDNLKDTIRQLVEINNRNKSLIEQSLEMIEFNINFIQSARLYQGNNYTKDAEQYDIKISGAGMFDTKQ